MGGYGSSDITANIEVNLNNIDRSTQDAATLASQLKDWGSSIEAANKQLQDYNTTQEEMLQTASDLAEAHEKIVSAARELRDISAASSVNIRDMAQNAREIQSALSGLGGASGAPYIPGMSSASPASVVDSSLSPGMGMPGAPEATPADFGMSGGGSGGIISSLVNASIIGNSGNRGSSYPSRPNGTVPDNGSPNSPVSTKGSGDEGLSYGELKAKQLLGINYWMPGGKTAALGRYIDRISGGSVTKTLGGYISNHPRIFGSPGSEFGGPGSDAFTKSMMDSGIGPMTAEQAAMLPQSAYSQEVSQAMSRATIAAEAEGGLAVEGTAGLMGSLGGLMQAAAPIAAAGYIGMKAYDAYSTFQQQGQVLGSLTGQTGAPGKMVGMEATDFLGTLFNPLMSYGTAKEIQMTGMAAGFQGDPNGVFGGNAANQGLLGKYTGFAAGSYQKYGMSPQDSMAMFNSAIIQAGGTVQQLTASLDLLAQVSASTNTSFSQLQANFAGSLSTVASLGGQGSSGIALAGALANPFAGDQILKGAPGPGGLLSTQAGIALTAQAMGISYTQLYTQMAEGHTGAVANGTYSAILTQLRNMGVNLSLTEPALSAELDNKAMIITNVLQMLLPYKPDGSPYNWAPNTAVEFVKQIAKGNGNPAAIMNKDSATAAADVSSVLNNMTGGKTGSTGATNFFNNLGQDIGLGPRNPGFSINYKGKTTDYTKNTIEHLPLAQQQALMQELANGTATISTWANGFNKGTTGTLGSFLKNSQLINAESKNSAQVTIGFTPNASKYFTVNGQKNATIQWNSNQGNGSNTLQVPPGVS